MVDNAASKMEDLVKMLIEKNTMKGVAGKTHYIDIVKDVLNVAPVHWIANEIVRLRALRLLTCTSLITTFILSDWPPNEDGP